MIGLLPVFDVLKVFELDVSWVTTMVVAMVIGFLACFYVCVGIKYVLYVHLLCVDVSLLT